MATGAAVASAATGAVGLKRGKDAADDAADSAGLSAEMARQLNEDLTKMGEEGIAYSQQLMDNWEGTFGGIQNNLADYYSNLDPDKFATQNKSTLQQSMDKQMQQYNDTMAAGGLQTAGMKDQAAKEAAFRTAEGNAAIDIAAPEQVNQMKQGFLNFGEGQRAGAMSSMENSLSRQGNLASTGANAMMGSQNAMTQNYANSSAGYMGAGGNMIGGAIGLGIASDWGNTPTGTNATNASAQGYGVNQGNISGPRRPDGML